MFLKPKIRVITTGYQADVATVLMNKSLRNVIHAFYITIPEGNPDIKISMILFFFQLTTLEMGLSLQKNIISCRSCMK